MPEHSQILIAQVVLPNPPLKTFSYSIPSEFQTVIRPGHRVLVPLGKRKVVGYVARLEETAPVENLRPIAEIMETEPALTSDLLELTAWISGYYMTSWGEVIRAALPPGFSRNTRLKILKGPVQADSLSQTFTPFQQRILEFVDQNNPVMFNRLQAQIQSTTLRLEVSRLNQLGLLEIEHILDEEGTTPALESWIRLKREPGDSDMTDLKRRAPRQWQVLRRLMDEADDVQRSALDVPFSVLSRLEQLGWIRIFDEEKIRDPYEGISDGSAPNFVLTTEQEAALQIIFEQKTNPFQTFLLHGITGSGKTQVYIEAIRRIWDSGRSALVLIPEISLTPQAVQRYRAVFGESVAVLHSRLSPGERFDAWRQIRSGKKRIALGPRSTVFAPLKNLGLIIVDEEHEASYKQMDPAPRYHARDVAVFRGKLVDCPVILGSATPSIETYYNAQSGKYRLTELRNRIDHIPLPEMVLVSLAEEWKPVLLSELLLEKITDAVRKGEQVILLQNRRGYSVLLQCGQCGAVETCPHCDISLTFHQKGHRLKCHYCGFEKPAPDSCPACSGQNIRYQGAGTQRVQEELENHFPEVTLFRMDLDTMRRKHAHTEIIQNFENRHGDILLGTQMVAKGHDFPGVSLVGIISADTGLHFPDFRAGERSFQLLTQAAGRAGRKRIQGTVIVQTRYPDHPVLKFAETQDYSAFYTWELSQREELTYPPFGRIALIRFSGRSENETQKAAVHFRGLMTKRYGYQILGPAAAPLAKARNHYRFHIILKGARDKDPVAQHLRQVIQSALTQYTSSSKFPTVRVAVDIDPIDMM